MYGRQVVVHPTNPDMITLRCCSVVPRSASSLATKSAVITSDHLTSIAFRGDFPVTTMAYSAMIRPL